MKRNYFRDCRRNQRVRRRLVRSPLGAYHPGPQRLEIDVFLIPSREHTTYDPNSPPNQYYSLSGLEEKSK